MAADLNARYATAAELAEDLRACFLKDSPTSAAVFATPSVSNFVPRKPIAIVATGILAVALGLASLTFISRRMAAASAIQNAIAVQQAYQRLRALNDQALDQLADKLAQDV